MATMKKVQKVPPSRRPTSPAPRPSVPIAKRPTATSPRFRFIIVTYSTPYNANGQKEHFATVTSVITGYTVAYNLTNPGEATQDVMEAFKLNTSESLFTIRVTLPRQDWELTRATFKGQWTTSDILDFLTPLETQEET